MNKNIVAIFLKSLAVFFIVSMDVIIKKISIDFPTFQIVFFRCLFGLLPVTLMLFITQSKLKSNKMNIHILRAIIATIVMFCFFKSVSILPLADVSSISFASIMMTTILAIFFLKEKVGFKRWFAILFGFVGVIIVFRPGTSIFSYYSFFPLVAAFGLSFAIILLKHLLYFDKPPTCSFYLHFFVALFVFPTILLGWEMPNANQWFLIVLMGLFGGTAQILATNAYKLSKVSILIPFDYSAIIWAITFGIIFFNDHPDKYVLIGSLIIVISTYYIIYRERIKGQNINLLKINRRHL